MCVSTSLSLDLGLGQDSSRHEFWNHFWNERNLQQCVFTTHCS